MCRDFPDDPISFEVEYETGLEETYDSGGHGELILVRSEKTDYWADNEE